MIGGEGLRNVTLRRLPTWSRAAVPLILVSAALASGCRPTPSPSVHRVEYLSSPATEGLSLPFSEAVRVDDTLYLSGQIGNLPGTLELAPGGIAGQTRQTLENIRAVLESHGSSLADVVKCTVFMDDIGQWAAMNEVYVTFFPERPPARSALGADGLALGALLEIECIAVVGDRERLGER